MSNIVYVQIDVQIEKKLYDKYGDWLYKYNCLPKTEGCYCVAAMCGDEVAGFATLEPQRWPAPLEMYEDAFIDCIEVEERYRRQGIGRHMVGMLENWAKERGYRQIRAWSNYKAVAALHMWYAMNYAMCPAKEPILNPDGTVREIVPGFKYAKILNPSA